MVSFDDFPSNASLKTTGYFPGFDRSIDPEAKVAILWTCTKCPLIAKKHKDRGWREVDKDREGSG